ncbi:unnamed protein product [Closterium sp. NIES-65]|nr:unnamed protein product [Closterium sp. NIES-65]
MEALDGPLLLRVAEATGEAVTSIANIASVSRAFARVARSELWPRYCLARAALAEDGEAAAVAAVAARLVREAGSADAPRNAASVLARCMSACPGVVPACSNALRVEAEPWNRWSGKFAREFCSDTEEESGAVGGSVGVGGGKVHGDTLEESGVNPHVSDSCALSCALATRLFLDECFLPAPFCPSPLILGEVEEDEKRKARGEDKGEGDERGKAREEVRDEGAQEGAAVLMAAGDCGKDHEAEAEDEEEEEERCEVVRGAIAGFRHSRFHSLLQGQAFAASACPFCHDQCSDYSDEDNDYDWDDWGRWSDEVDDLDDRMDRLGLVQDERWAF